MAEKSSLLLLLLLPGPGPYLPKARELYTPLEQFVIPNMPSILTSDDGPYWRAVRQATAPCFSATNLKKVERQQQQQRLAFLHYGVGHQIGIQ